MTKSIQIPLSLKAQGAWLIFARTVSFGLSFLLPLLVVRFFSMNDVGLFRQSFLIVTNAVAIIPCGMSMSAYYYLARDPERRSSSILNILVFNFLVGAAVFAALAMFPQSLGYIFRSDEIVGLAPVIGLVIWIWIFSAFLETVAVANQESKIATALIISSQFTKTLFMVAAAIIFTSVASFLYAAVIQGLLQTLLLLVYLRSRFPGYWKKFDPAFFREQLAYALPLGLAGVLWVIQTDVHNYFVAYRFSPAEFAIYAYGCFQLPLITMISESVNSVLIPKMSQLQSENDKKEMFRVSTAATQKLALFFFPTYVFLLVTAPTFVTTLFTREYAASVPIFIINLTFLPFLVWINDPIIRAYNDLGQFLLKLRIVTLVVLVASLYFGVQSLDMRGMIGIVVVTFVIEKLILTARVLKKLEVKSGDLQMFAGTLRIGLCAAFAGIVTFLFYWAASDQLWKLGGLVAASFGIAKAEDFISGSCVLAVCFLVFAPLYLWGTNQLGVLGGEKQPMGKRFRKSIDMITARFSAQQAERR